MGDLPDGQIPGETDEDKATAAGSGVWESAYVRHEPVVDVGLTEFRIAHVGEDLAEPYGQFVDDGGPVRPVVDLAALGPQLRGLPGETGRDLLGHIDACPEP